MGGSGRRVVREGYFGLIIFQKMQNIWSKVERRVRMLIVLALMSGLGACDNDPCAAVVCENDGVCIGGACDCPEGFTGVNCEISLDPCVLKACADNQTDSCLVSPVTGEARCFCSDGFEGERCERRWEDKFANAYLAAELCNGQSGNFPVEIQPGPDPGQITFVNFANRQPNNLPAKVVGNLINSTVFEIYEQFMPFGRVTGSGSYRLSDSTVNVSYLIIQAGDTTTCSSSLSLL